MDVYGRSSAGVVAWTSTELVTKQHRVSDLQGDEGRELWRGEGWGLLCGDGVLLVVGFGWVVVGGLCGN